MIYLLLASFLWGTSFIAGKFAYETLDPALVVLFRLIIAGGILFPITLRFIKENSQSKVNWRNRFIRLFDLSSHILIAVYWFAIYISFKCSHYDRYRTTDGYPSWSVLF